MVDQAPLPSGVVRAESSASAAPSVERKFDHSVCLGCGCLCDDINISIAVDAAGCEQIAAAERACELGRHWFGVGQSQVPAAAPCRIAGQPATFEEAIDRAARILVAARAPLVVGMSHSPTASLRAALALAEQLGATIDSTTSRWHAAAQLAMQAIGEVTCTWGEIASRSDLVICWGADPITTHPRNLERYSLEPKSEFLPRGRDDRTLVVIDDAPNSTAELADQFIALRSGSHFEALWTLRALVQGIDVDDAAVERATGVLHSIWRGLVERMKSARYGALLLGPRLEHSPAAHVSIEALLLLVRELNDYTRFVVHALGSPGNAAGCDEVFTWTTGYPFAVDLRRGYPRYLPDDGTAALLLERGEVDAVLAIGDEALGDFSAAAMQRLKQLPVIALGWSEAATLAAATVAFRIAQPGVAAGGTVYRSDGVPLALRPALAPTEPSELDVLTALARRVTELQKAQT